MKNVTYRSGNPFYGISALLLTVCLIFLCGSLPVSAENGTVPQEDPVLTEYELYNSEMSVSLPEGWYFNTQDEIDQDFLKVTENTQAKLKKYLLNQHIEYNLVSKDLKSEINVIVLHNTNTKLIFDFNTLEEEKLRSQLESLVDTGSSNDKTGISASYSEYDIKKINGCTYTYSVGEMSDNGTPSRIVQYSTMINGYGINVSIKSYDGADYESDSALLDAIVGSIQIDEIKVGNRTKQMIIEFAPPALMVLCFLAFTVYVFVVQIRKNKKK